ncbi:MAG: NUDIX domain-containing protein [Salinivirgaceae bacterium]
MLTPYQIAINQLIAVDNVVFGYHQGELKLLLFARNLEPELGKWSLIGGWVNPDESVENAATRVLQSITGLQNIFMEQVQVFSKPDRDPGGRVISVVFYALINIQEHNHQLVNQFNAQWWSVNELPELIFDHRQMVNMALEKLRFKAGFDLVGRDLLPAEFTLTELRNLYNAIFFKSLDPGNFRKKILSLNALNKLDKKDASSSKKGAYLYKFKKNNAIDFRERIVKW